MLRTVLAGAAGSLVTLTLLSLQSASPRTALLSAPDLTPEMLEILSHMKIVYIDEVGVGPVKTLRIGGVNVQIVNENVDTYHEPSDPTLTNGHGNLILGWNTPYGWPRTGSHNLALGIFNGYQGSGGIVNGSYNRVSSTSGGAAAIGGTFNHAGGTGVTVGGADNQAAGGGVTIGGSYSGAGFLSDPAMSSPYFLIPSGTYGDVVVGGRFNAAGGGRSTVVGGSENEAEGQDSAVGGGLKRATTGTYDWAAGSLYEYD